MKYWINTGSSWSGPYTVVQILSRLNTGELNLNTPCAPDWPEIYTGRKNPGDGAQPLSAFQPAWEVELMQGAHSAQTLNAEKVETKLATSHTIVDAEMINTLFGGAGISQKWEYLFTEFVLTKEGWYLTAINRTMAGKELLKLRVDEVAQYAGEHGWEMVNSMMTEEPIEKRWKSIMEMVTRDTHETIRVLMLIFKRQKR